MNINCIIKRNLHLCALAGISAVSLQAQTLEIPQAYLEILPTDGEAPYDLGSTSTTIADIYSSTGATFSGSNWTTYSDESTVHTLSADVGNSTATAYGSTHVGLLNDPFVYDPLNPLSDSPANAWSSGGANLYHALETSGVDVVLSFTLAEPLTITSGLKSQVLDIWGRNSNVLRDDDIDILLYNGDYTTVVGQVTGLGILDNSTSYVRVDLSFSGIDNGVVFDRIQIVGHDSSAESHNRFTLAEVRLATLLEISSVNDESKVLLASISHGAGLGGDEVSVIDMVIDSANSTPTRVGTVYEGLTDDSFAYDALAPSTVSPAQSWGTGATNFYQADIGSGQDAILSYLLTSPMTKRAGGIKDIVLDLWGRTGSNGILIRDNSIDILLYNGDYSTVVASITGAAVSDDSSAYVRIPFDSVPDGTRFDRMQIVGHDTGGYSNNYFTLAEVRLATVASASALSDYNSFNLGIGKAGQIYSFRNNVFGEAIPPQNKSNASTSESFNPWIDEVFHMIQVATRFNSIEGATAYYLHQAGTYQYTDHMPEPFYSPDLLSGAIDANTYVSVNWVQQGHLNPETGVNDEGSYSIVYSKYRVISAGIIEVTQMAYNFGAEPLPWFNVPWGGVRDSSFGEIMVGDNNADGSASGTYLVGRPHWADTKFDMDDTGGWCLWAQSTDDDASALGLVLGRDTGSVDDFLRIGFQGAGSTQTSLSEETTRRNYQPMSMIRRLTLNEDDGLFARYYYVVGSAGSIQDKVEELGLVEKCTVEVISGFDDEGDLYSWRRSAPGAMPTLSGSDPVLCHLRDRPVNASFKPVFVIEYDGAYVCTFDPYKYTDQKPYQGTTQYVGLLGYANTDDYSEADLN